MSRILQSYSIWLLVLVVVLTMHLWFPEMRAGPLNDTYSVEVSGRKAIYQLSEQMFTLVKRNRQPFNRLATSVGESGALALLGPARYPTKKEWEALLAWVNGGGRLLIAARLDATEPLEIPGLDCKVTGVTPRSASTPQPKATKIETVLGGKNIEWWVGGKIEAPANTDVLVRADTAPEVVRLRHGMGQIIVVASDYVFSNNSLYRKNDNGVLAYRLLSLIAVDDVLSFDEHLNAIAAPTIEGLLLDEVLRPITLQLMVLLVVFAWWGNRRFGAALPIAVPPRRDIADHTNALGNLYYKRHNAAGAVKMYLEQLRGELKISTGKREEADIDAFARRIGQPVVDVRRMFLEAEDGANNDLLHRHDAARIIRQLAELRRLAREKASHGSMKVAKIS